MNKISEPQTITLKEKSAKSTEEEIKFKELEKEINRTAIKEKIQFIQLPLEITKVRTRLLLLSSITIIGLAFNIEINPQTLGFKFNNEESQNFPIIAFLLISLLYLLIYFIWNVIDYISEYKIRAISKRAFGSFQADNAKPEDTLMEAVNSFINYLNEFFNKKNIPSAVKNNFEVSYKRMGIYAKGLSIFKKSQLLRFYFLEIGLPLFLSATAIIMIMFSLF